MGIPNYQRLHYHHQTKLLLYPENGGSSLSSAAGGNVHAAVKTLRFAWTGGGEMPDLGLCSVLQRKDSFFKLGKLGCVSPFAFARGRYSRCSSVTRDVLFPQPAADIVAPVRLLSAPRMTLASGHLGHHLNLHQRLRRARRNPNDRSGARDRQALHQGAKITDVPQPHRGLHYIWEA